ncbi:MAG: mandelate racemase/muconate lactonizing enzyme family protein [Lautropia sp.]
MMLRIDRVECIPFSLPLAKSVRFAGGQLDVTEHVLLRVHAGGLVGIAEAPSRPFFYGESQRGMVEAVHRWFGPLLIGADAMAVERIRAGLAEVEHNNTVKGAIDIALHDLIGQALGVPCHRLLGAWSDRVAVTYICGYGPPAAMAEEAIAVRERHGIGCFKLKVGIDPVQDVAMLHALRRALPDATLYVDGNSGLNGADAVRVLDAGYEVGLVWAEEPVHRDDRPGRAFLARHTRVPIMGDESCRNAEETARELDDGFVQVVAIKTARTGFRGSRDIIAQCAARRVRNVIASQGDSTLGIVAGLHFAVAHQATAQQPAELTFHLNTGHDLLEESVTVVDGHLIAGAAPGLGVHIDAGKLARYRVDGAA